MPGCYLLELLDFVGEALGIGPAKLLQSSILRGAAPVAG